MVRIQVCLTRYKRKFCHVTSIIDSADNLHDRWGHGEEEEEGCKIDTRDSSAATILLSPPPGSFGNAVNEEKEEEECFYHCWRVREGGEHEKKGEKVIDKSQTICNLSVPTHMQQYFQFQFLLVKSVECGCVLGGGERQRQKPNVNSVGRRRRKTRSATVAEGVCL